MSTSTVGCAAAQTVRAQAVPAQTVPAQTVPAQTVSAQTAARIDCAGAAAIRLADVAQLVRPKIAVLELTTVAVAALLAGCQPWLLLHALLGTGLLAAGASALNQWLERDRDARMARTADRPLPAGRLSPQVACLLGSVASGLGLLYLAIAVNLLTAGLGLLSWAIYVWLYTPLKSRTPLNTPVGAVAGALPVLMGWTAMGRPLDLQAATLFMIVFLWQFPHFMAIAWLYRRQYAAAGLQMLSVVDPSGLRVGGQAVVVALALLPVSLLPVVLPWAGSVAIYFPLALLLGMGQLVCAWLFLTRLDEASARRLLRASLIYLPSLLGLLLLATPI